MQEVISILNANPGFVFALLAYIIVKDVTVPLIGVIRGVNGGPKRPPRFFIQPSDVYRELRSCRGDIAVIQELLQHCPLVKESAPCKPGSF